MRFKQLNDMCYRELKKKKIVYMYVFYCPDNNCVLTALHPPLWVKERAPPPLVWCRL